MQKWKRKEIIVDFIELQICAGLKSKPTKHKIIILIIGKSIL